MLVAGLGLFLVTASSCTVIDVKAEGHIKSRNGWVLLPMQNLGETHLAGERVEELLSTLLRIKKGVDVAHYEVSPGPSADLGKAAKEGRDADAELELDEHQHYEKVLSWARQNKYAYGIGGSVQEWRYRSGTEGEPAVGLTLRVIDLASGRAIFTAAGSSPTPGRGTLSGATQELLGAMLAKLPFDADPKNPQ